MTALQWPGPALGQPVPPLPRRSLAPSPRKTRAGSAAAAPEPKPIPTAPHGAWAAAGSAARPSGWIRARPSSSPISRDPAPSRASGSPGRSVATSSCACTGTSRRTPRSRPRCRTSLPCLGQPRKATAGPLAQVSSLPIAVNPNQRLELLLADALPPPLPHHAREPAPGPAAALLLPGQLHPHRHSRRRRLLPTPNSGAPTPSPMARNSPSSPAFVDAAITSEHRSAGACWTTVGGARARSKFFLDGDSEFPTICGTGTEDYVGGAYDWMRGRRVTAPTPRRSWACTRSSSQTATDSPSIARHVPLPRPRSHRFQRDLRVTIQDLGFHPDRDFDGRGSLFMARQDDICSVAYWYQTLPTAALPARFRTDVSNPA